MISFTLKEEQCGFHIAVDYFMNDMSCFVHFCCLLPPSNVVILFVYVQEMKFGTCLELALCFLKHL